MPRDLATACNENFEGAFAALADVAPRGDTRQFGDLRAVSAGVQAPMFNRVFAFDAPSSADLADAVAWLTDRPVPFQVVVADDALAATRAIAADLGLAPVGDPMPGMALAPLDDRPPADAPVDVSPVTTPEGLAEFASVTAATFGVSPDVAQALAPPATLESEAQRLFVGHVDGRAVASGTLVPTDAVAGVYSIGVRETARNRGVGTAMTRAVLQAGREAGCDLGVLQASPMGLSVYERMGFAHVEKYHTFEPA